MSGYIGTQPVPQATQTRDVFTATSGQTTFATSGYTPNFLDVWLNGVKLVNGDDFTATNGSDVVLTSGAAAGDTVEVLSYSTFEVNSQTFTGGLTVNNNAATVLTVDRATSDGTLVDIKKNGSTVGSIGTYANEYYYGSPTGGDTFLRHGWNGIVPATSSGTDRDAAIQLGSSVSRFKDLYLSGGVYLGGTGATHLLNDYERGTFTPTFTTNGGGESATYSIQQGSYIKVGNLVYVHGRVRLSSWSGGSSYIFLSGLPFTANNSQSSHSAASIGYSANWIGNAPRTIIINEGYNYCELYANPGADDRNNTDAILYYNNAGSTTDLIFSLTYEAT